MIAGDAAPYDVSPLAAADAPEAIRVLARAFRDNPLNRAVIRAGETRRLRANLATMEQVVPVARRHGHALVARAAGAPIAALLAAPPGGYPLPPPSAGVRLRALARQGLGVASRWRQVFLALDALHPVGRHWYLGILGVDPAWQRRGVGGALLARFAALADADASAAYLETDRAENVVFYARAGFHVVGETSVLGTRVWRMERPGRL